ncbi:MAG: pitrilysin family protein [Verrucomicrobiota bacterium]
MKKHSPSLPRARRRRPQRPSALSAIAPPRGATAEIRHPPSAIPPFPPGVRLHTLHNGLVLIIGENHTAPVVSAQAWCHAGSMMEGKWLGAGLSHVLEHMLFKGTTTRPGSRIDQEVQDAGGYMNAYTSFDRTVFHINVPNTGTKVAVDILCDIMQNASLPDAELAKELDVIRREMDMNRDDPGRRSGQRLFESAYTRHPCRFTVIGYPEIFNQLKPDDIRAYYRERYVPNNLFLVVVGDLNREEVLAQIQQAFVNTNARAIAPVFLPSEPRQTAPREVIEEAPIELAHFHFAWHIPDLRHPDMPALDILAALLGHGRSSRLFREVREKKGLVTAADAWTYTPGDQGLFGMSAVVDAPKFIPARDALLAEVQRVRSQPVPAAELAKVVKQFIAGALSVRKTMQGQAQDLAGNWLAANDLNFSERYLAAVKRVSPAAVRRVARQYLTPVGRTLYALLPAGAAPKPAAEAAALSENPIQKIVLPNGLRLLLKEDHRLPFVEIRSVFQGGVLAETLDNHGLTQLMTKMLLQGTARRSAEQIALDIESIGGSIDSFGGNNSFGLNLEVLSGDLKTGLDVFADVLLHPSFPSGPFERERRIQLESIRAQRDQLLQSCGQAMRRALFGGAGYGLDPSGTEESVQAASLACLAAFHKKLVVPNNCVLAIFGDIRAEKARAAVQKYLGRWKQTAPVLPALPPNIDLTEIRRVAATRDKAQAVIVLGFPGTTLLQPDRYPLELLQEGCSDLGSRLFLRIREKLGLAYYVGAQNFLGLVPGYFAFYVGTAPEKLAEVEKELLAEAELLRAGGLTDEELRRAKAKVIGQRKISRQDLGSYAMSVALDELYGLGYQHFDTEDASYEAVTADQVRAAARKYLTPTAHVVSLIKPA